MKADEDNFWANNLISSIETLENVMVIPTAFHLRKPYPNPFNPLAIISYEIPLDCDIKLSIYDVKGRLVEELISSYTEAGYYEITWDAGVAASGMYFLRLVTPYNAMTQKMILMK